jgi:signal transduction histidine kinase/ligand-binding sensor domain-containing protein
VSDSAGVVWIASTDGGLNRLEDGKISVFTIEDGLPDVRIDALLTDTAGRLWIGARDAGLAYFDGSRFVRVEASGLRNADVTALIETRDGLLMAGTSLGTIVQVSGHGGNRILDTLPADGKSIHTLLEDQEGTLWIGTNQGGLLRYRNGRWQVLTDEEGLSHNTVLALVEGREGCIWIGTDGGGLARLSNGKFTSYSTTENLSHDYTFAVFRASDGDMWIGTDGGGVNRFRDGHFQAYRQADGLAADVVYSIAETADGSMWFGTQGGGLSRLRDGRFATYTTDDGLGSNTILALFTDGTDRLWIAPSTGGLLYYTGSTFEQFVSGSGQYRDVVTVIAEGIRGDLWIGTVDRGLSLVREGRVVERYSTMNGLLSDFILSIHVDAEGVVWVGTREGGLQVIRHGKITRVTTRQGLFDDSINAILEDAYGNLWMTSNKGLFSVSRKEIIEFGERLRASVTSRSFDRGDGLRSNEFNGGFQPAGATSIDGRLWFPSDNGVVVVNPGRIPVNSLPPIVTIQLADVDGQTLDDLNQLNELDPGSKKFEFRYVGLSLLSSDRVTYRYRLDGVDDDWVDAGSRREAYYTNLEPGSYTFRVRARNRDGVWSEEEAVTTFYLRPHFYESMWFVVLSGLVLAFLIVLTYRVRVAHLKQRHRELELLVNDRTRDLREEKERTETALLETDAARREAEEQKEIAQTARAVIEEQAEKLRQMDEAKSRFFGNISHEFRTPLTLTIGPLENALSGAYGSVKPALSRQLQIMLRNSRRLLRLINQLLDLSKLESGKFRLRVRPGNLVDLLEDIVLSFTPLAESKEIALSLSVSSTAEDLYYDPEALEKVFFNLLSNAFKFTPRSGTIRVDVAGRDDEVEVRVSDSGDGISADQLPRIFDRFHQVAGSSSEVQVGTGIGLALVKELVERHGGTITVSSVLDQGTEFRIVLRRGTLHLRDCEIGDDSGLEGLGAHVDSHFGGPHSSAEDSDFGARDLSDVVTSVIDEATTGEAGSAGDQALTVLVVDDNADIREYVRDCLRGDYRVVTAEDGQSGVAKVRDLMPDLVISDVAMPGLDGLDLCRTIKADEALRNVPVVLLTSKTSLEDKLVGLEAGSDDYLAKPFNAEELRLRVRNLLRLRTQARELTSLNSDLVRTNDALREASEIKSQLLNIASHDMKNPLTAIREFAKIIRDEVGDDSPILELVNLIQTSSEEMLSLVTRLLDSSALEANTLELDRKAVDMGELAAMVTEKNRRQAQIKGQTIEIGIEGADLTVSGDRARLREAMDNLISNAVKYSDHGQTIWVTVERRVDGIRFQVRDEGPGIEPAEKPRLFGKFQRLSNQPTGGESSTGLGLNIVKQIVELHGGQVWAESERGVGSRFLFEISALNRTLQAESGDPDLASDRPMAA